MCKIDFKFKLSSLEVDAEVEEGFNIFRSESATGKTRAFNAIYFYCQGAGLKCKRVTYQNWEDIRWEEIKGFDVVLLDDTDLYMDRVDYIELAKNNRIILSDIKEAGYALNTDVHVRSICMQEDKVVIR